MIRSLVLALALLPSALAGDTPPAPLAKPLVIIGALSCDTEWVLFLLLDNGKIAVFTEKDKITLADLQSALKDIPVHVRKFTCPIAT